MKLYRNYEHTFRKANERQIFIVNPLLLKKLNFAKP